MRNDKPKTLEYMQVRYTAVLGIRPRINAKYERSQGEHVWRLCHNATQRLNRVEDAQLAALPQRATICGTDHTLVRTAKIHTAFREKMLRRMYGAQKVLCNMVLFQCMTCNERVPTWHPRHRPDFELECLKDCETGVHEWYGPPGEERTRHAT